MKTTTKRIIAIIFVIVFAAGVTVTAALAHDNALPRGDSDIVRAEESLAEQFEYLLLNITSQESRNRTLEQAYQSGLTADDLKNVPLTDEELLILSGEIELPSVDFGDNEPRTTSAPGAQ